MSEGGGAIDTFPLILVLIVGVPFGLALLGVVVFGRPAVVLGVGIALALVVTILPFARGCPEGASECYPELGAIAALIGLLGWAAGVAAGTLLRRRRERTERDV